MKRTICIWCLVFALVIGIAAQSRAFLPLVALSASQIGATIAVVAAAGATTYIAQNPSAAYEAASEFLAPVVAYNKYLSAGSQIALGYTAQLSVDLESAFNQNLLQAKTSLSNFINSFFDVDNSPNPAIGDVIRPNDLGIYYDGTYASDTRLFQVSYLNAQSDNLSCTEDYDAGHLPKVTKIPTKVTKTWYTWSYYHSSNGTYTRYCSAQSYNGNFVNDTDTTWPNVVPPAIPSNKLESFKTQLADAAAADPDVRDDLDNVIAENPGLVDIAPINPITPADAQSYAQTAVDKALQDKISSLQDLVTQDPTNLALQAELAKAQADAAQKAAEQIEEQAEEETKKETFDGIESSPFADAYSPGEFDIPNRFTSFLNNVKSSGLFSFSTSFFNSLPDGGSSVYEIDGGETFGSHSVDLSETLSPGLAVLKTILLAVFGFLSIRAIIMKR